MKSIKRLISENSTFRISLGDNWQEDLESILDAARKNPCLSCGDPSGISIGRTMMHKHLDNVEYFVSNIDLKSKGEVMYNWVRNKTKKGTRPTENDLDELHHTLEVISRDKITNDNLVDLGKTFQNGEKKYDILKENAVFHELKNKNYVGKKLSNQEIDQVIEGYIKNIDNFDNFTWEARYAKLKDWGTLDDATEKMRGLWKNALKDNLNSIFEEIYKNQILRNNMFNSQLTKKQAKIEFTELISKGDESIFKHFIVK